MKIEGLIMPSVTNFYLIIPKLISYSLPKCLAIERQGAKDTNSCGRGLMNVALVQW